MVGAIHLRRGAATLRGAGASESGQGIVGCEAQETNESSVLVYNLEEPLGVLD